MSASLKPALEAVVLYLRENPGVVSLIVGEAVVVAAKYGVHVTAVQLTTGFAVLLPLLLGYFHVARKASVAAATPPNPDPQANPPGLDKTTMGLGGAVVHTTADTKVAGDPATPPIAMGFGRRPQ